MVVRGISLITEKALPFTFWTVFILCVELLTFSIGGLDKFRLIAGKPRFLIFS